MHRSPEPGRCRRGTGRGAGGGAGGAGWTRSIGRGYNRNIVDCDPSAHAEIVAMREAGRAVGNHRLVGASLYCTLEPCIMCAGAIIHARLARLVFAADDPKTGAVGSVFDVIADPRHNHRVEVVRGVMAEPAASACGSSSGARRAWKRNAGTVTDSAQIHSGSSDLDRSGNDRAGYRSRLRFSRSPRWSPTST